MSMTAGGSLREAESRNRAQRLSSTGRDLTYTQSYPQWWITLSRHVRCEGISAPGRPHTGTRHLSPWHDGCGTASTRVEDVASASRRPSSVDCARGGVYTVSVRRSERRSDVHEADVSTESAAAREDARLSRADEYEGRAQGAQAAPCEGSQTADRVAGRFPRRERLTTSAEFQALFQRGQTDRSAGAHRALAGGDRADARWIRREPTGQERRRSATVRGAGCARRTVQAGMSLRRRPALVIVGRPAVLKAPFAALDGSAARRAGRDSRAEAAGVSGRHDAGGRGVGATSGWCRRSCPGRAGSRRRARSTRGWRFSSMASYGGQGSPCVRLARCHPFNPGGYDPPPTRERAAP